LNRKIRTLIVEDESSARAALRMMLDEETEINVIAECRNGREAVQIIREQSPDLVFIAVQMPGMDGFQVVEEIGRSRMPVTIFVTADDKYARRAFEAHVLDYLLKPFDRERFNDALQRAKTSLRNQMIGELSGNLFALLKDMKSLSDESFSNAVSSKVTDFEGDGANDRVIIKSKEGMYFLKIEEIQWIEAAGDYLSLHTGSRSHLIRETMGNFYAKLKPKKFLRIHRSIIVNIERIKEIRPLFKGEHIITLTNGKSLKSSRGYRRELQTLLDEAR
jgi:two-component system LytT family response regulator